jgi:2-polyprenyl-3-methyl-5-hydroxy-6-metoxy-1,4-benzoquinol methylase
MTATSPCRICGNLSGNMDYTVREMQFGTREPFFYFQCGQCGCLQIAWIPDNLAPYYPAEYFSFRDYGQLSGNRLRAFVDRRRVRHDLGGGGLLGGLLSRFSKPLDYPFWIKTAGLGTDARVLDVGCGGGKMIARMRLGGFASVAGIDPFLAETVRYPSGLTLRKMNIQNLAEAGGERYDFIMFHHSFEHMDPPLEVLQAATSLLADGGSLLIRIPVADSEAFAQYRQDWFQLDAPRHLYLHSRDSLSQLAKAVGLRITYDACDATPSQFMISELYRRDISLNAPATEKDVFSADEIRTFAEHSRAANRAGKGDQAVFLLGR